MSLKIILASASPRRREILENLGLAFRTVVSNVSEEAPDMAPRDLVVELALRKARAVTVGTGQDSHDRLIIGVDTVVVCEDEVIGKPRDAEDAHRILEKLSGRDHWVLSGLALVLDRDGTTAEFTACEETIVRFKRLLHGEIERYVATGDPLDKAGAYGIQGRGGVFVERIEGCYFNVVGLPIHRLYSMAASAGIDLFQPIN